MPNGSVDSQIFANRARTERAAQIASQSIGLNPDYVSLIEGQKPTDYQPDTGAAFGSYPIPGDLIQIVLWNADANTWEDFGKPQPTKDYVDNVESSLQESISQTDTSLREDIGEDINNTATALQENIDGSDAALRDYVNDAGDFDENIKPDRTLKKGTSAQFDENNLAEAQLGYDTERNRLVDPRKNYLTGFRDTGKKVNTIADLKNEQVGFFELLYSETAIRHVLYGSNIGDNNGGTFYWDAASTAEENGYDIIKPAYAGFSGPGRWKLIQSLLDTRPFRNGRVHFISGVVRYYSSIGKWDLLENHEANPHFSLNCISVSSTSSSITVNFNRSEWGKGTIEDIETGSFVITPDETLASEGIFCGSSVNPDSATVELYKGPRTSYVAYSSGAWTVNNPDDISQPFWSNDRLIIPRPASGANDKSYPQITPRDTPLHITLGSVGQGGDDYEVVFYETDGTQITSPDNRMKFFVSDPIRKSKLNPNADFNDSYGNLWFMGTFTSGHDN